MFSWFKNRVKKVKSDWDMESKTKIPYNQGFDSYGMFMSGARDAGPDSVICPFKHGSIESRFFWEGFDDARYKGKRQDI